MKPRLLDSSGPHFRRYYCPEESVFTCKNGVEFKKTNLILLLSCKDLKFRIRGSFIFLSAATCRHILRKIGVKLHIGKTEYYFWNARLNKTEICFLEMEKMMEDFNGLRKTI